MGKNAVNMFSVTAQQNEFKSEFEFKIFDEQFTALDSEGNPISDLPYYVVYPDGKTLFGRTSSSGKTRKVRTQDEEEVELYWADEALAKQRGD